MEELPKISNNHIIKQDDMLKQQISQGTITTWLNDQLKNLADQNPNLYKYVIEHSQKFAFAAMSAQDVQSIAISQTLEQMLLLYLIGTSSKDNKEYHKFSSFWDKFFPNGINGLNSLGKDNE